MNVSKNPIMSAVVKSSLIAASCLMLSIPSIAGVEKLKIKSDLRGNITLGIAVHDQREEVVKGEQSENVIGKHIAGVGGRPWVNKPGGIARTETQTTTKLPFSEALSGGMKKSLAPKMWPSVVIISLTPKLTKQEAIEKIRTAGLGRTMLVTVDKLWAEASIRTTVQYKMRISILNEKAEEIANADIEANQTLMSSDGDAVAAVFSQQLSEVLRRPEFKAALTK